MEGMEGEVYIDNADDNTEMEVGQETEEVSEEWAQLADSILTRAGDSFDWTYDEVDIVTLRECEDIQVSAGRATMEDEVFFFSPEYHFKSLRPSHLFCYLLYTLLGKL